MGFKVISANTERETIYNDGGDLAIRHTRGVKGGRGSSATVHRYDGARGRYNIIGIYNGGEALLRVPDEVLQTIEGDTELPNVVKKALGIGATETV